MKAGPIILVLCLLVVLVFAVMLFHHNSAAPGMSPNNPNSFPLPLGTGVGPGTTK